MFSCVISIIVSYKARWGPARHAGLRVQIPWHTRLRRWVAPVTLHYYYYYYHYYYYYYTTSYDS